MSRLCWTANSPYQECLAQSLHELSLNAEHAALRHGQRRDHNAMTLRQHYGLIPRSLSADGSLWLCGWLIARSAAFGRA